MPINTADNNVKTYACTKTTIISKPEIAVANGTEKSATPIPVVALLNISAKIAMNDKMAKIAM
jgi:hypothetical protein